MKKLFLALPLLLASCATAPQTAAVVTPVVLPPEYVREIQVVCVNANLLLSAAARPGNPKVILDTAADAEAYCKQLGTGVVPPTTDHNTKGWLSKTAAALPGLLQAASAFIK